MSHCSWPSNPAGRPYGTNFITWENLDRRSWTNSGFQERTFCSLGVRAFEGTLRIIKNFFDFCYPERPTIIWMIAVAEMFSSWNSTECQMGTKSICFNSALSYSVWIVTVERLLCCFVALLSCSLEDPRADLWSMGSHCLLVGILSLYEMRERRESRRNEETQTLTNKRIIAFSHLIGTLRTLNTHTHGLRGGKNESEIGSLSIFHSL